MDSPGALTEVNVPLPMTRVAAEPPVASCALGGDEPQGEVVRAPPRVRAVPAAILLPVHGGESEQEEDDGAMFMGGFGAGSDEDSDGDVFALLA
jgi:hypothetical protein